MEFRFWCFLWVIIISLGTYHPKWRMLKYAWLGYGHHYAVMKYIRNSSVESDMWASGYGFHFPSFWFLSSLCRVQLDARVSNEKFLNNPRLTSMSGPGNALQPMIIYRMVIVEGRCTKLQLLISYIYNHWLTQKYSEFWLVRYNGFVKYCCTFLLPSCIYNMIIGWAQFKWR